MKREPLACAAALAVKRGVGLGAYRRNAAAAQCLREPRRRAWAQRESVAP